MDDRLKEINFSGGLIHSRSRLENVCSTSIIFGCPRSFPTNVFFSVYARKDAAGKHSYNFKNIVLSILFSCFQRYSFEAINKSKILQNSEDSAKYKVIFFVFLDRIM